MVNRIDWTYRAPSSAWLLAIALLLFIAPVSSYAAGQDGGGVVPGSVAPRLVLKRVVVLGNHFKKEPREKRELLALGSVEKKRSESNESGTVESIRSYTATRGTGSVTVKMQHRWDYNRPKTDGLSAIDNHLHMDCTVVYPTTVTLGEPFEVKASGSANRKQNNSGLTHLTASIGTPFNRAKFTSPLISDTRSAASLGEHTLALTLRDTPTNVEGKYRYRAEVSGVDVDVMEHDARRRWARYRERPPEKLRSVDPQRFGGQSASATFFCTPYAHKDSSAFNNGFGLEFYYEPETQPVAVDEPADIPQRDPREVDELLDRLGMMLALAASAQPPAWGAGGDTGLRASFNWHEAVPLAHTVETQLLQLRRAAGLRFNVKLTRPQVRRMKALFHWVRWLYERAEHSQRAENFADYLGSDAVASNFGTLSPEERREQAKQQVGKPPERPGYPLNGPVPDQFGPISWPGTPMPVSSDSDRYLEIAGRFAGDMMVAGVVFGAQAADIYFTGGLFFLAVTGTYGYYSGNLTPLGWQLMIMTPGVGVPLLAGLNLIEGLSGEELEVKIDQDKTRFFPIKLATRPLESLADVDLSDPETYPWERIGKVSMAGLLTMSALRDRALGQRRDELNRQVLADPKNPPKESFNGEPIKVRLSLDPKDAGLTTPEGLPVSRIQIEQPVIPVNIPGVGDGRYKVGRLEVDMRAVVLDAAQVGKPPGKPQPWRRVIGSVEETVGPGKRFFHPKTGEELRFLGFEGYHGLKHFRELYPFGEVLTIKDFKTKQIIPRKEWSRLFEQKNHRYHVREMVPEVNPNTGAEVLVPKRVPGLFDIFGKHPQLREPAREMNRAFADKSLKGEEIQSRYVEFVNKVIQVFKKERRTETAYQSRFKEEITYHAISYNGYTVYIPISPEGQLLNAMALSRNFQAQNIHRAYRLQRGARAEPPELAMMGDLVDTIVYRLFRDPFAKPGEGLSQRLLDQLRIKTDLLREALRADALLWYRTGNPAEQRWWEKEGS